MSSIKRKHPLVKCDAGCGKLFPPKPQEEEQEDGNTLLFLMCPFCMTRYPSALVSPAGAQVQKEIEYLRRAGKEGTAVFRSKLKQLRKHVVKA